MARLLLVVDSLDGGGAERHVIDLAAALRERGHAVTVGCSATGVRAADLAATGVPAVRLASRRVKRRVSAAYAARLAGLVRRARPDLVHAHLYASATAAALATAGWRVPLVVTEHTEAPWRGWSARGVSRAVYRRADAVVAVSAAVRRLLVERYDVPPAKVRLIHPVPPLAPRCASAARFGAEPTIGCVARLAPEKGVDVLLTAFAAVAAERPDSRLVIVGDGPGRPALERQAAHLGLADAVRFLGYRPDVPALLASFDVFALASRSEGAPLAVLEALAAGVAVVATAVGGVVDQLADGRYGLLVPPDDPAALAGALRRLLDHEPARRALAAAGRHRAAEFSFPAAVDAVEAVYAACLDAPHPPVPVP